MTHFPAPAPAGLHLRQVTQTQLWQGAGDIILSGLWGDRIVPGHSRMEMTVCPLQRSCDSGGLVIILTAQTSNSRLSDLPGAPQDGRQGSLLTPQPGGFSLHHLPIPILGSRNPGKGWKSPGPLSLDGPGRMNDCVLGWLQNFAQHQTFLLGDSPLLGVP